MSERVKNLVSIIVPCYNVAPWLEDCFKSIESQTYKQIEVVFVDDGSTDDTLSLLRSFTKDKKYCRIVSQENQGLSAARNTGIRNSMGEFLYFFDSDDILSPKIIEILHKTMVETQSDCVGCKRERVEEDAHFQNNLNVNEGKRICFTDTEQILKRLLQYKIGCAVWDKLYRAESINEMHGTHGFNEDIKFSEDLDFNFRLFSTIKKFTLTDTVLYFYRKRNKSLVRSKFNTNKLSSLIGMDWIEEYCKTYHPNLLKFVRMRVVQKKMGLLYGILDSNFNDSQTIDSLLEYVKKYRWYLSNKFLVINTYYLQHKFKVRGGDFVSDKLCERLNFCNCAML